MAKAAVLPLTDVARGARRRILKSAGEFGEDLIVERQMLRDKIKQLEASVKAIDDELLPYVEKEGGEATFGDWRVLRVQQKMSVFDRDHFKRYLLDRGVRATLLSAAEKKSTSEKVKAPFLKVTKLAEKEK